MASCSPLDTNCSLRPWRFFFLSPPSHSKMFQVIYFLFHLRCLSVAHVLSVSCTVFNPLWRRRWRFFTSSLVPTLMSRSYQNLFVCCLRVSFPLLIFFSFVMFFFQAWGIYCESAMMTRFYEMFFFSLLSKMAIRRRIGVRREFRKG